MGGGFTDKEIHLLGLLVRVGVPQRRNCDGEMLHGIRNSNNYSSSSLVNHTHVFTTLLLLTRVGEDLVVVGGLCSNLSHTGLAMLCLPGAYEDVQTHFQHVSWLSENISGF